MKFTELIQSGMALVPIPLGMKRPSRHNWNLYSNCVTNSAEASSLIGLNIGLAHAYCKPTPTVALDVDNYNNAKAWLATHGIDLNALLLANDSVVIHSGKKLSLKLLYRLPIDYKPLESKKILGPDCKSALEFRCATKDGKTVQDVLPPSIHPDGYEYRWIGNGNPLHIPSIPAELLTIWELLISNGSRVAFRQTAEFGYIHKLPESPRQIATITDALKYISADCSYEMWRNVVWAILSTGWLCAEDIALKWSQTAPERFDWDSFWLVANSFIPDLSDGISVGTIYHHARLGGWNV
jgi:putative DNA primase/helicase